MAWCRALVSPVPKHWKNFNRGSTQSETAPCHYSNVNRSVRYTKSWHATKKTKLLWLFRYSSRMVSKLSVAQKSICGTEWRFVVANKNHNRCTTRFYPRALIVFNLHERHSTIKPIVHIYTISRRHEPVYHFRIFFTDFNIKRQRTTKHR